MVDLHIGGKVYVFKNKLFGKYNLQIDENMFGEIVYIKQWEELNGWADVDINRFNVNILLLCGKQICIKDGTASVLFRKYDFIKADVLDKILNYKNKQNKEIIQMIKSNIIQ
jgi:hypothetical protein